MKKLLAIVLAVAMLATFAIGASAAAYDGDGLDAGATENGDVTVNVTIGGSTVNPDDVTKTYSVNIAWDSMDFEFLCSVEKEDLVWDPDMLAYTNMAGAWATDSANIVVTNKSNDAVKVSASLTNDAVAVNGVTATLTGDDADVVLGSAAINAAATEHTYTVTIGGTPTILNFTVGTVTVTVSKNTVTP